MERSELLFFSKRFRVSIFGFGKFPWKTVSFNKFKQFLPQLNPVNLNCCLKFKKYSSIYILQFASDELNIKQTD